ncbi:Rho GTPase activation protein [Blastocladiella britannica]|nr:Rho GTPase activation protein [Blastocladiella britannica]
MALSAIEAEDTEQVVTQLLELEGGLSLLLEQVKRNQNSAKDLVSFFKKRAVIEEEYGKSMQKLCHSLTESVDRDEGKCRSFSDCIRQMAEIHGSVASNRLALATHVAQVGEELASVMKDSDRSRRQLKDSGERFEKQLSTAESLLDKARGKQETTNDAWERAKAVVDGIAAGAPVPPASGAAGLFFGMARANPDRDEEDARHRAARANDGYQTQLAATIRARAEFQSTHLPTLLRSLKEVNDEGDVALQYHLSKYAFHYEQVLAADASSLCPALPIAATAAAPNGGASSSAVGRSVGIRKLFEAMDHAGDLQAAIVKATAAAANNGGGMVSGSMSPTRDGVAASLTTGARSTSHSPNGGSGALSSLSLVGTPARPMFGLSLMELAERDDTDTPRLLVAVTRLVEEIGLETVSVYRQPGNHMAVQKLRALCDRDFDSLTWIASAPLGDIPALTSLVKLFLRSLSDSLLPRALHREFLTAAKTADSRSQLLAIHDLVNRLPDPHYATLRHLMLHLDRIAQHAGRNRMSWVNLSIVFGPCLMHSGAAAAAATGALAAGENALAAAANPATGKDKDGGNGSGSGGSGSVKESTEMHFQCKVVELILKHSRVIFEA